MLIIVLVAIRWLLTLLYILIFVRSVVSWLPNVGGRTLNAFLLTMTEPVLAPTRKLLNKFKFVRELPVDLTPMVAIIVLYFIRSLI